MIARNADTLRPPRLPDRRRAAGRGFTIVEVIFATLITGITLVAALEAAGGGIFFRRRLADSAQGRMLARNLLDEILRVEHYADPASPGHFGAELDETLEPNRAAFDDVDDYHDWSAQPPQDRDGTKLTDWDGWRRRVTVEWVDPAAPDTVSGADAGVKRITVEVFHNDLFAARLTALRADLSDSP
jgi:type II secretory pathway pseudopilin PulG